MVSTGVALARRDDADRVARSDAGEHRKPDADIDRSPVLVGDQVGYVEVLLRDPAPRWRLARVCAPGGQLLRAPRRAGVSMADSERSPTRARSDFPWTMTASSSQAVATGWP